MFKSRAKTPLPLADWISISAFLNCAGWLLSALHQLNRAGYAGVLLVGAAIAWFGWRNQRGQCFAPLHFHPRGLRFHRFLPRGFLILSSLALLGGILHPPTNFDALAYRMPRVLHWLAAEHWYWVHTYFNRLNTRAVGFEWLAAPLMSLTGSDRSLFLINIISFLLLPGLFFSILVRLGIRHRVAWSWMWILPTGYTYLLQAGSIGNDLFGATFALAALDLALRARTSKSCADLWLSMLAAALLSGSKLSNLPLLLPWLVAALPSFGILKTRIFSTATVAVASVVCSFLPMAIVNYDYCRDWTGFVAEGSPFNKPTYALHLAHNTILLTIQNFAPPIFPFAGTWNAAMLRLEPPALKAKLEENFEPSQAHMALEELQVEEGAGIGFGVSMLLLLSLLTVWKCRRTTPARPRPPPDLFRRAVLLSPLISLAVFMAKSGLATEARLATPYYGVVIPLLLVSEHHERIVKSRWWRAGAWVVFLLAALLLVVSPPRPLWPAQTILSRIPGSSRVLTRAKTVYSVYAQRADCFAPARAYLPADVKVLGLIAADYPETSLWRPFGSRRIEHITSTDTPENLRARGVQYILLNPLNYNQAFYTIPFNQWLAQQNAEVVQTIPLTLRATLGSENWLLVKIKGAQPGNARE